VRRCLPDRKRSADIINRCARYTEREAAANQGDQHGGFRAIDLLLVDKLASKVGNGNSPWNKKLRTPVPPKLRSIRQRCDRQQKFRQLGDIRRDPPRFVFREQLSRSRYRGACVKAEMGA
jgi:hypothetical protein